MLIIFSLVDQSSDIRHDVVNNTVLSFKIDHGDSSVVRGVVLEPSDLILLVSSIFVVLPSIISSLVSVPISISTLLRDTDLSI